MSLARYLSKLGALLNSDGKVPSGALASGAARANFGAGAVLQVVQVTKTDQSIMTTPSTWNDIPAQGGSGTFQASITPSSASSKILVIADVQATWNNSNTIRGRLMRDSTAVGVGDAAGSRPTGWKQFFYGSNATGGQDPIGIVNVGGTYLDSPNTTSQVTYKVQVGMDGNSTTKINSTYRDTNLTGNDVRTASSIILLEIAG